MTTRADDLRAAADQSYGLVMRLYALGRASEVERDHTKKRHDRLHQHADAIERIEREMRLEAGNYDEPEQLMNDLVSWANTLRGDTT